MSVTASGGDVGGVLEASVNNPWSAVTTVAPALTDVEAAWLAALIDGEGTIGIWRERRAKNASGFRYKATVRVFNTNFDLVARVRELTGCYVGVKDRRGTKRDKHKTLYMAVIRQSQVPKLLAAVGPYLIAKKRQADMVTKFCAVVVEAPMRTSESHEMFEHFYLEMRALNARGTREA